MLQRLLLAGVERRFALILGLLVLTVLAINLLGDGLRDAMDPQQRR